MERWIGKWALPPDVPSLVIAIFGAILLVSSFSPSFARHAIDRLAPRTKTPWTIALASALLSVAWIAWYLRGGPRIIDATTYFLQARALAHGDFSFHVPDPSASFRGRFLLYGDHELTPIFPPGWPLLLSIGFVLGVPMLVGPLLAAAIAIVTASLARELGANDRTLFQRASTPSSARTEHLAAALSLVCACLRYHTADTMSHGAAALGFALAVLFALRKKPIFAGLALGWLIATRIPTGIGALFVVGYLARRDLPKLLLGTIPFVLVLLVSQKAATGSFFHSAQATYYAKSDGPPGCFFGFGRGVGCVFEHGDVVAWLLPNGYGPWEWIVTSASRLWRHVDDIVDGWPLTLALLPILVKTVREVSLARVFAIAALVQLAMYAPFYFNGNYPGGGARHLADVLPFEHALVAVAVARFEFGTFERRALALVGVACLLFGVHTAHAHVSLRDRDGGRPMFEPEELAKAHAQEGVIFLDTDHGFALAHDPKSKLVAARWRDDGHDRLLYDRLGSPPSYRYRFGDPDPVISWTPPPATDDLGHELWRFEAESDWPPLAQSGGYAIPFWASSTCASNGRVLDVIGTASIELPVPKPKRWQIQPRFLRRPGDGVGELRLIRNGEVLARWEIPAMSGEMTCFEPPSTEVDLAGGETLEIQAKDGRLGFDRTLLMPAPVAP